MGLAEPRKRLKIAHDPRNLSWSDSTTDSSFGRKLMQQQGWQQGQSLGSRASSTLSSTTKLDDQRLAAAKVGVIVKDDTLGLGAQLKSKDVQHQKTGLDAFQGLLGRLNAKDEVELAAVVRKDDDRKLEVYAQGRWGGMVFVRGGVLVQGEEFKKRAEAEERAADGAKTAAELEARQERQIEDAVEEEQRRTIERRKEREEKRRRKEERRARKAAKAELSETDSHEMRLAKASPPRPNRAAAPDEPQSSDDDAAVVDTVPPPRKRRRSSAIAEEAIKKQALSLKNGRHVLRGRNIEAKRKAFSDTKGLDAIFMRT